MSPKMSIASSSSLLPRTLGRQPLVRYASSYSPESSSYGQPPRPPRPSIPAFFTGYQTQTTTIETLNTLLSNSQQSLRQSHIYPLPAHLKPPQPPQVRWKSIFEMTPYFGRRINVNTHRRVTEVLNDLLRLQYIAELGDKGDVADKIGEGIQKYLKADSGKVSGSEVKKEKAIERIDEFGRALGMGKRKTASASVWIIPTKSAQDIFGETTSVQIEEGRAEESEEGKRPFVVGQVLVNHVPLSTYFQRPLYRETILRPLRLSGLLGAYNVFARVQGGGPTGQAGAVALGLARALLVMRGDDVKDVLMASSSLRRDPRMKERKKTNLLSARTARAWVKR